VGVVAELARRGRAVGQRKERSGGHRDGPGYRGRRLTECVAGVGDLGLGALREDRRQGDAEWDEYRLAFHRRATVPVPIGRCQVGQRDSPNIRVTCMSSPDRLQFRIVTTDSDHVEKHPDPSDPHLDLGTAGQGARRQHGRRRAKREADTREQHPHIGGLLLRLQAEPQRERAWRSGAVGEEEVAEHLAANCPAVPVLHDRRMPASRANIDHIAIAPSGVLVIDTKRLKGKIEVRKPLFGKEKLVVAGRDKTKLVEGLRRQVDAVRAGLEAIEEDVPVRGCFCFVNPDGQAGGSGIPLLRTLTVEGFPLYYPRRLSKRLNRDGPMGPEQMGVLTEALVELFPAA
jgi:hypothetical protein